MKRNNMNANSILTANLLDILFDGRNKAYGAYELRKSYNKRIMFSLVITLAAFGFIFLVSAIVNNFSPRHVQILKGPDVVLQSIPPVAPPVPPQLPPPPAPPVATVASTPPLIVKDNLVVKPPPDVDQIANATIDLKTSAGVNDMGIPNPPDIIVGSQVVAAIAKNKNDDSVFIGVEIEASFPGGAGEWSKYVSKAVGTNINEFSEDDFGTCMIRFIVDKEGKVSQVEATTMKGSKLAEIATNAIRKGPSWIPAQQNGVYVNAYRFQPVILANPNQ